MLVKGSCRVWGLACWLMVLCLELAKNFIVLV